jgi:hypothetical protein
MTPDGVQVREFLTVIHGILTADPKKLLKVLAEDMKRARGKTPPKH